MHIHLNNKNKYNAFVIENAVNLNPASILVIVSVRFMSM